MKQVKQFTYKGVAITISQDSLDHYRWSDDQGGYGPADDEYGYDTQHKAESAARLAVERFNQRTGDYA